MNYVPTNTCYDVQKIPQLNAHHQILGTVKTHEL